MHNAQGGDERRIALQGVIAKPLAQLTENAEDTLAVVVRVDQERKSWAGAGLIGQVVVPVCGLVGWGRGGQRDDPARRGQLHNQPLVP